VDKIVLLNFVYVVYAIGATCGAGTAYSSGASLYFSGICVVRCLVFCVVFCWCLFFLLALVLSVLLQFMASDVADFFFDGLIGQLFHRSYNFSILFNKKLIYLWWEDSGSEWVIITSTNETDCSIYCCLTSNKWTVFQLQTNIVASKLKGPMIIEYSSNQG
jgi:hypothetical protein